mgnify:CR=1 FL=1
MFPSRYRIHNYVAVQSAQKSVTRAEVQDQVLLKNKLFYFLATNKVHVS